MSCGSATPLRAVVSKHRGELTSSAECVVTENPLAVLRERVNAIRVAKLPELPPFVGGAVGYAGYDTVRYVEKLPNAPEDDRKLPDLSFAFYDHMVVFDNVQKTAIVVVLAKTTGDKKKSYDDACRRVDRFVEKLSATSDSLHQIRRDPNSDSHAHSEPSVDIPKCHRSSGT